MAFALLSVELDPALFGALAPRDRVTLSYDPSDPHALSLEVDGTDWVLERMMLDAALRAEQGAGRIRLYPCLLGAEPHVAFVLDGFEPFSFALPSRPLTSFLSHVLACVPPGTEADFVDLDAELRAILDQDGP